MHCSIIFYTEYKVASEEVRSQLPSKDDMDGAVLALLRLQDTYKLNTSQLADSNLGLQSIDDEAPPLSGMYTHCWNCGYSTLN